MTDYKKDIDGILERAVEEKTFSLEAVEAIKKMRERNIILEADLERLEKENADLYTANGKLISEQSKTHLLKADLDIRQGEIERREREADMNELKLEHAQTRVADVKEMFGTVFRNPIVKEQVFRNGQVPVAQNGYVQNQSTNENETKTTEVT